MATPISLVSWNLHGVPGAPLREERMQRVATEIARRAPELVLLQEVWLPSDADRLAAGLAPAYREVPWPDMGWLFRKSGLMALLRQDSDWRLAATRFSEFRAEAPAWKLWQGDGFGDKGVQQLTLERDGLVLHVLHTHLQAAYGEATYREVRAAQLDQLAELARAAAPSGAVVGAGDLNTQLGSPLHASGIAAHWIDLTTELRRSCGCGTAFRDAGRPWAWIDYVLAFREAALPARAHTVELLGNTGRDDPFSDHNGFHAWLVIGEPGEPARATFGLLALLALPARRWTRRGLFAALAGGAWASLGGS